MNNQKYCPECQDWYSAEHYPSHMAQHNIGKASYDLNVKQYTGNPSVKGEDYAVCVLHQKKCPCPVSGCNYKPFGWIRKSLMMKYCKQGFWETGLFTKGSSQPINIPIDVENRIVVIYGVPIHIRI